VFISSFSRKTLYPLPFTLLLAAARARPSTTKMVTDLTFVRSATAVLERFLSLLVVLLDPLGAPLLLPPLVSSVSVLARADNGADRGESVRSIVRGSSRSRLGALPLRHRLLLDLLLVVQRGVHPAWRPAGRPKRSCACSAAVTGGSRSQRREAYVASPSRIEWTEAAVDTGVLVDAAHERDLLGAVSCLSAATRRRRSFPGFPSLQEIVMVFVSKVDVGHLALPRRH
jgi:hypothetical protein